MRRRKCVKRSGIENRKRDKTPVDGKWEDKAGRARMGLVFLGGQRDFRDPMGDCESPGDSVVERSLSSDPESVKSNTTSHSLQSADRGVGRP